MVSTRLVLLTIAIILTTITTTTIRANGHFINEEENIRPLKRNVTCFCSEDEECDAGKRTCRLQNEHQMCYESWSLESHVGTVLVTAGCILNDDFFTRLICSVNHTNRYIVCCSQRDFCNDLDAYSSEIRRALLATLPAGSSLLVPTSTPPPGSLVRSIIIAAVVLTLCLSLFGIFCFVMRKPWKTGKCHLFTANTPSKTAGLNDPTKTKKSHRSFFGWCSRRGRSSADILNGEGDIPADQTLTGLLEWSTSTAGPAAPLLTQRTFARQIDLEEMIGNGRYGSVYRGKWREDFVAVKIFSTNDERSWFREVDIYQTVCLRHENILGYIAADNKDAFTHTQLWLVTEYHANGSVYDYLMNHTITVPILIKMMLSIASGLCHLHMPIDSTNGKVALAHRDLKTKNILVKKDLTCCIGDLGLAVKEVRRAPKSRRDMLIAKSGNNEHVVIDIQANSRVGTQRYMAPEVLAGTMNERSFESYKAADIYALGLVFWEILRRCQTSPNENDTDEYQVPYEHILPSNPTVDQLREAICTRKVRPPLSPRWQNNTTLSYVFRLCQELWIDEPSCRLSALKIKKELKDQFELVQNELAKIHSEAQQQSTQINGPWTT